MLSLDYIQELLLSVVAVLVALSIHEFSHAYAAYRLGDNTAKLMGRLTLNPIKHIDPVGALFMIAFRFGWAKPVPINARNFKKPKRDFAITAIAGPLSNIITAFISSFFLLLSYKLLDIALDTPYQALVYNTCLFLSIFTSLNVGLGIFNLIPVPPFDGSRLLNVILPERLYFKVMQHERQIYWGVIAWLFFGHYFYRGLVSVPFIGANPILSGIASVLDLSGLISKAISFLLNGMLSIWSLIPFLQ